MKVGIMAETPCGDQGRHFVERNGKRPKFRTILAFSVAAGLAGVLTGCDAMARGYPSAVFRPESAQASAIRDLAVILLIIGAIAFVIVEVWLFLAVFRYRNRPEEEAVQTHGNLRLESAWTLATAVVIFAVLGMTIKTMVDVASVPPATGPVASGFPGGVLELRAVGRQFWWEFEYPQFGFVTANEAHIPAGVPVRVQLESGDVIHSFWVPRLSGKTDMIPGQINYLSFVATQPGEYYGLCGEFCGLQHANMRFRIVVEPAEQFVAWAQGQDTVAGVGNAPQDRFASRSLEQHVHPHPPDTQ